MFYFVASCNPFLTAHRSIYTAMATYQHTHAQYYHSANAAASTAAATKQETLVWKLLLLTALTYLVWSDRISITLAPFGGDGMEQVSAQRTSQSLFGLASTSLTASAKPAAKRVTLPAGPLQNSTLAIDPAFAQRNSVPVMEARERLVKCQDYVERFAPVAVAEMQKYGIPASMILAQGLLESDAGESALAQKTNNHFGVKCFSKQCHKGHCANFTDDSHKDFFIKYTNAWGSFRAHSQFLKTSKRYAPLFKLDHGDYRGWANGLTQAGYATDKKYGEKLIAVIQNMKLDRFDR